MPAKSPFGQPELEPRPVLDACPFCAKKASWAKITKEGGAVRYAAGCYQQKCYIHPKTGWWRTPEECAFRWNRRVP
jgi:hypothetical protein